MHSLSLLIRVFPASLSHRSSHSKCWIDLLRAVAGRPESMTFVTVVRAGLNDIPQEVCYVCHNSIMSCTCVHIGGCMGRVSMGQKSHLM
jgi:hypothetical protein